MDNHVEIAYVRWEDAFQPEDDTDFKDIEERCILQAAGIVVRENEHRIVLAVDVSTEQNNGRGMISIPKVYILELRRITSGAMKNDTTKGGAVEGQQGLRKASAKKGKVHARTSRKAPR